MKHPTALRRHGALLLLTLSCTIFTLQTQGDFFEDLFKGVNLDELFKAMEEEAKAEEAVRKETGRPASQNFGMPAQREEAEPALKEKETEKFVSKSPRELFIDPTTKTVPLKGEQKMTVPTDQSFYNYKDIMGQLIAHIHSIDKKITTMNSFTPAFREEFYTKYGPLIDQITVAHDMIESKKIYTRIFLAPPPSNQQLVTDMKKLRQGLYESFEEMKRLDNRIILKPEDEEKERNIDALLKLAQESTPPAQTIADEEEDDSAFEDEDESEFDADDADSDEEYEEYEVDDEEDKEAVQLPPPPPAYLQDDALSGLLMK